MAKVIEKNAISVFIAVPFMFSMLAKANFRQRPDFSSLRLCVSASAPMPKKLNQEFYEHFGIYVRQLYGSTETGTISVHLSSAVAGSLDSVGTPLAGVEVEIFAEDGRVADADEVGEVAVKSPAATAGYEGLEEVNRETFRDGYFFTGDLGRRGQDGLLYLVGRKKFFVNKGGYKINPHDIEALLERHPKVAEAVVVGEPTSYGDEQVHAESHIGGFWAGRNSVSWVQGHLVRPFFKRCEQQFVTEILSLPYSDSFAFTRRLLDRLQQNAILCITGDVGVGQKLIPHAFLGHTKFFATGMVSLAKISGAAILPLFCVRERDGQIRLIIERPVRIEIGVARERGLEHSVAEYVSLLESYIGKYPEQYHDWPHVHRPLPAFPPGRPEALAPGNP